MLNRYDIGDVIFESSRTRVFRAVARGDGANVIVKTVSAVRPAPGYIAQLRKEYETLRRLDCPRVVRPIGLEALENLPALVLEDFGGASLKRLHAGRRLSLIEFLQLALEITEGVQQIHEQRLIHRDINPSNIVINRESGVLKIIDFGLATELAENREELRSLQALQGTLPYISPEQTGRMNRTVDARTDLYSLGATLYELFTGAPPFTAEDPAVIVHSHLAVRPQPLRARREDTPEPVEAVVMKLLAKAPEERYQSCVGLMKDLERCLREAESVGVIVSFTIGSEDVSDRFQPPQKLYGRDRDIARLVHAFRRALERGPELLLVAGYPGIGKTALVNEIHRPVVEHRGYFAAGKFDQLEKNVPYSAFVQAMRDLLRQILSEPEERIAQVRAAVLNQLGPNAQLLIEIFPELEAMLGPQPPVRELLPQEAQNRFRRAFVNFLTALATPERPLALFLDDLQWADAASLYLVQVILTETGDDYPRLLLIGAYRDSETEASHPLLQKLEEIRAAGGAVSRLELGPLAADHVVQFVADMLGQSEREAEPLARLCLQKTNGNPFFLGQFLKRLHEDGLIRREGRYWRWDLARIRQTDITDNVVELLIEKIGRLPPTLRRTLMFAACIGARFQLQALAILCEQTRRRTSQELWQALQERLVAPIDEMYRFADLEEEAFGLPASYGSDIQYQFLHDRVQQAAYSLLSDAERLPTHLKIGRMMYEGLTERERDANLFHLLEHFNHAARLITGREERALVARLNLKAGRKARSAAAYEPAFKYFEAGLALLPDDAWQQERELAMELHASAADAAFLSQRYDRMEAIAATALAKSDSMLERGRIETVRIQALMAQNKPLEAIALALPILDALGVHFPRKPNNLHVILGLLKIKLRLRGLEPESLLDLPRMSDPEKLMAVNILQNVFSSAYFALPALYPLIMFSFIRLSLQYGNAPASTIGYGAYGVVLCGLLKDFDNGYRFGLTALRLVERLEAREVEAKVLQVAEGFTTAWKVHYERLLPSFIRGYEVGLETGDFEFASYTAFQRCYFLYWGGYELDFVRGELARFEPAIARLKQKTPLYLQRMELQVVMNLLGEWPGGDRLQGDVYDESEMEPIHRAADDKIALYFLFVSKMHLGVIFEEWRNVVACGVEARRLLADGAALGSTNVPLYNFFEALALARLCDGASAYQRFRYRRKIAAHARALHVWAERSPIYFAHRSRLVDAERARLAGRSAKAARLYQEALDLARQCNQLPDQALILDAMRRNCEDLGQRDLSRALLLDVHYTYSRWGARARTRQLELDHPELARSLADREKSNIYSTTLASTVVTRSGALDTLAILKAAQTISSELALEPLLQSVLTIIMENAGAEYSALFLDMAGVLTLACEKSASGSYGETANDSGETYAPPSILNFVSHSRRELVLADAQADPEYSLDPAIRSRKVRSACALPLLHRGKHLGLIYLENSLMPGVFTPDRVNTLLVLAGQAAISIDIANNYAALSAQNQQLLSAARRPKPDESADDHESAQ